MIPVLVVSHGPLARELVAAAERINGSCPGVEALCLDWNESREGLTASLQAATARLDQGDGVLILSDMAGSTPSNLAVALGSGQKIQVVTGVNLAMVLRIACFGPRDLGLADLAKWVVSRGRRSIRVEGGEEKSTG
jgi:PTS system mannose-specific IIA component